MFIMHCRIVLCDHGSDCCDRRLCHRQILSCLVNCLFKLSCGNLSSDCRFFSLHSMPWGIVLRDHGSHSCDRNLRSGLILRSIRYEMFKLPIRSILILCIFC